MVDASLSDILSSTVENFLRLGILIMIPSVRALYIACTTTHEFQSPHGHTRSTPIVYL